MNNKSVSCGYSSMYYLSSLRLIKNAYLDRYNIVNTIVPVIAIILVVAKMVVPFDILLRFLFNSLKYNSFGFVDWVINTLLSCAILI